MTLVFDRRAELGAAPMCHALLVGVSDYRNLPAMDEPPDSGRFNLRRLASPALSAWEVCRWLIDNRASLPVELGSVRVLLSPSALEAEKIGSLAPGPGVTGAQAALADWTGFVDAALEWRADAARHRDGMTFFYYAGHGLQQFGSPILTLADFADPRAGAVLQRAFNFTSNFLAGMAPGSGREDMALRQLYFIDACREPLTSELGLGATPGQVWDPLSSEDPRATPVFMATFPGSVAQTIAGEPTDFCKGLLECLGTAAEERDLEDPRQRWPVTSFTLNSALDRYFKRLGSGQYIAPTGVSFINIPIRWLEEPPAVELSLVVAPDAAIDQATLTLFSFSEEREHRIPAARPNHPYRITTPAGIYRLTAEAGERYQRVSRTDRVGPGRSRWPVTLEEQAS